MQESSTHANRRPPPADPPPLPGPPLLRQDWRGVVLTHWALPPEQVTPLLPPHTRPDVLDGAAHVGLVAFHVPSTTAAGIPVGGFGEVNVRLYSVDGYGRRGVVFLSMDADSAHNVLAARALTSLPYMWSDVSLRSEGDAHAGAVRRRLPRGGARGSWRATVGERLDRPGPLEHFVTARWGLHTRHAGRTWWIRVRHRPWPLYRAHSWAYEGDLLQAAGVHVGDREPVSVLWSPGVDTVVCPSLVTAPRT
ncbi:hypothetical protein A6A08_24550 [Nocardiopsis sp. TSRI0078]|uniref:DUF2071 domain-containing protein n=1 Tax=unclassified Nocardiopsis TaxID=2649073 RepID=UPI000938A7F5|nr:DUF2071 domain-containing protein [Nocardiopsis sp. TSRI0078]OKI19791.1 hypothetical protein A6A08_24550 [Nocardiopsis sp. TSRI0078]